MILQNSAGNRRYITERRAIVVLLVLGVLLAGWRFLQDNPQHNPWAPLDLRDPVGWATQSKLSAMLKDAAQCREALERSGIEFTELPAEGDGNCARPDRTVLDGFQFAGRPPPTTCPIAAGLEIWMRKTVEPAALEIFGSPTSSVEHLGAFSCRRLYGRDSGPWSEHATGNAIDIAGFTLENGTRISLLRDWDGDPNKRKFLLAVRDGACPIFGTVLSPDYNAAHRDHFHFDQASRNWNVCN